MELLALWMVAGVLLMSAVVFGWVAVTTHAMADDLERRTAELHQEDLIRRACARLDEEHRLLLEH